MKQKIYILGLATAIIIFLGISFKVSHLAGAAILLITGISILVFVFMPLALINSYKAEGNRSKLLYIITWLTAVVIFTAMLSKIQHWPGSGYLLLVSIPFPFLVFLPVFLVVTSGNKNHNIYNTVRVLFLLMIISCFTVLLALDVSKEKMVGSFGIAHNYYQSEKALDNLDSQHLSKVDQKIDELLAVTEEYKDLYLGSSGIPADIWKGDPGVFQTSLSFQKPAYKFSRQKEIINSKLLSGLGDLISLLERTPGCGSLAAAAPSVFNLRKTETGNYNWDSDLILSSSHPWLLVYLAGLETNLKMIRVTIN